MKTSPTQRSLAHLRALGWTCTIVEKWNPHAGVRQDLFGFADLLALDPKGKTITAVQVTSGNNFADRRKKLCSCANMKIWLRSGGVVLLHGWAKKGKRGERKVWSLREERIIR